MSIYTTFGLGKRTPGFDSYSRVSHPGEYLGKINMSSMGKPAAYGMNGTGRDTYIAIDNGGFSKPFEPSFTPETGIFGQRRFNRDNAYSSIEAKHANYSSNGTGRDGYIA